MVLMAHPFHHYNSGSRRDVINNTMVYFFHRRPLDYVVLLCTFSHLHELLQRVGVMKPNESKSAKDTLCR